MVYEKGLGFKVWGLGSIRLGFVAAVGGVAGCCHEGLVT